MAVKVPRDLLASLTALMPQGVSELGAKTPFFGGLPTCQIKTGVTDVFACG